MPDTNNHFDGATDTKHHGFYRAKVLEVNVDSNNYGAIKIFVPDIFPGGDETKCPLKAYPANSPTGGYTDTDKEGSSNYNSTCIIPQKNSHVIVFFENGDQDKPYYIGGWAGEHATTPPENRNLDEPHRSFTLFKSTEGRALVVCDSADQARVEITGKKRQIKTPPCGDNESVYNIDNNMSTILIGEKDGSEQILIRTYLGDYIHIDVANQNLNIDFANDIDIHCGGNLSITVDKDIDIKGNKNFFMSIKKNFHLKVMMNIFMWAKRNINIKSKLMILIDGVMTFIQSGRAKDAQDADPDDPDGDRK